MEKFDSLINEQMKTMEQLLFLQSEIERCQEMEYQHSSLQGQTSQVLIKEEIKKMKAELLGIQEKFEQQTEEVIRCYQDGYRTIT
ncbi:YgaB family protein [Peribacillus sp. SCS-155]|uniref:YgaB family protein n=1 Tax=Peribacillus sedimenti TaxID=3115297 RepID=UPI003905B428